MGKIFMTIGDSWAKKSRDEEKLHEMERLGIRRGAKHGELEEKYEWNLEDN